MVTDETLRARMEELVRSMDARIVDYNGEATVRWITDDIMAVVEGAAVDPEFGPHEPGCDGKCAGRPGSEQCFA